MVDRGDNFKLKFKCFLFVADLRFAWLSEVRAVEVSCLTAVTDVTHALLSYINNWGITF